MAKPMKQQLVLSAPTGEGDLDEVIDLTAKVFDVNYYAWVEGGEAYFHSDIYDATGSTVGRLDGQMVTHWGVWDYQMRIGKARLRCGGIGAVATSGPHRKQGLMDKTARQGLARMREGGYDISLLFGIGDFFTCRSTPFPSR